MKNLSPNIDIAPEVKFFTETNYKVERVWYQEEKEILHINNSMYLAPLPKNVYTYLIAKNNPLESYLKRRKGRNLDLKDIKQIENITKSLHETLKIEAKIATLTKDF